MQLSLKFVVGLAATLAPAFVAAESQNGLSIPISRRSLLFGNDDLDLDALASHFKAINHKYIVAVNNYKQSAGNDHPLLRLLFGGFKRDGGTGTVDLVDIQRQQLWAGKMSFGGQEFSVDFDTGSADLIINPGAYDPSKSQTSKKTGTTFKSSYADGTSGEGKVYQDNMEIGGLKARNVAIGRSDETFIQGEEPNQGIAGMSFSSLSSFHDNDYKPFFDSLREQNAVEKGVFQFTLKPGNGSELYLGGIDKSKVGGDITWVDVDRSNGFWLVDGTFNKQHINAIIDSGSTIISGPTDQVRKFFQSLGGITTFNNQGSYLGYYDCNRDVDMVFNFGGRDFKLPKRLQKFGTVRGQCVLPVAGIDNIPLDSWIIGDTFFQAATVIFNAEQPRIGFADQA